MSHSAISGMLIAKQVLFYVNERCQDCKVNHFNSFVCAKFHAGLFTSSQINDIPVRQVTKKKTI